MADNLTAAMLPMRADLSALTTGGLPGTNKLWLATWAGEVMLAYDKNRAFEMLVDHRTVSSPVVEFPVAGLITGIPIWQAGQELVGSTSDSSSATFAIRIDKRPSVAAVELDKVDLSLTQWEYKSILAHQAAEYLANLRDSQLAVYVLRSALEPFLAASSGGATADPRAVTCPLPYSSATIINLGLTSATDDQRTSAALELLKQIEDYCVFMQENNIPINGPVYCAVSPRAFQDIRSLGIARDATGLAGGAGRPLFAGVAEAGGLGIPLATGLHKMTDALEYQGCYIIKTNQLAPSGALKVDANTDGLLRFGEAKYNLKLDTLNVMALIFQPEAVCSIRMAGLDTFELEDGRRNTVFMRVSQFCGTGVKKPELSKLICSNATVTTTPTRATAYGIATGFSQEYLNTATGNYPHSFA